MIASRIARKNAAEVKTSSCLRARAVLASWRAQLAVRCLDHSAPLVNEGASATLW